MNIRETIRKKVRWFYFFAAVVVFGIGGAIAFIGNSSDNVLLIVVGFAGLAGGFLLLKKWYGEKEARVLGEALAKPANCLVISKTHIKFTHVDDGTEGEVEEGKVKVGVAQGLSQKCYNDGKYYYIHKENGQGMEPFGLPDDDENERYYDPTEMANVVTMPSNKKYFAWSANLMQTIKIGIMALVVGGEIIGLVAIGG